jgi:small subunit ribosomal protein S17
MTRRILQGVVISNKSDKTVVVRVERKFRHPLYQKTIKSYKKYSAHDENNQCKENDIVRIEESRPISKTKKWMVKFD